MRRRSGCKIGVSLMKITEMTTKTFWKGELGVEGIIEDGENSYQVSLDIKGSQVCDYSCSCVTGNSYKGMCAHAEYVWKAWQEQRRSGSGKMVATSQEIRTMIREYTNREVAKIIQEGEEETVRLVPRLLLRGQELRLEFRIGRERLYVLKDLAAFAKAVHTGAFVEYGKNLGFHHAMRVFAEQDRALAGLVLELVEGYQEHYEQFQKSAFVTVQGLRELVLNRAGRDRFFKLMQGKELELEDRQGCKRNVMIQAGTVELAVKIERAGRDGIRVAIDPDLYCFFGERYLYVGGQKEITCLDRTGSEALGVFLEQMTKTWGRKQEVEIQDKDVPLFYERVLQQILPYSKLDVRDVDLESYRPQELKARFEFDSGRQGELTMRPELSYGSFSFHPIEDEKVPRTVCRDVPGEFRVSQLILKYFQFREDGSEFLVIRDDDDAIFRILRDGIPEFMQLGEVYVSKAAKAMKILPPPKVEVGVHTAGNWLELTVDAEGMSHADLARILSEYDAKKPYYRMKNGEFLQLDDNGLMTVARLVDGMAVSRSQLQGGTIRIPAYRALYLDSVLKEGQGITLYRDQLFKAVVRGMKSVEDSEFAIPQSLRPVLRGYQKTGFCWLKTLDTYGFGGILADDMGLGKTIQVLAVLLDEKQAGQQSVSLIVCPASLVYNWENEIHTFAPELSVQTIAGTAAEREQAIADGKGYDVWVTSYDLLKRDILLYEDMEFRYQVIDEAQYIKNPGTQSARAVKRIQAKTRYALTGTPIENRLSELWSIFDYLMPGFLFGYQKFKKEYEQPIVRDGEETALRALHRLIGPFVLRRLKSDVLKELPEKLETVVYSKSGTAQKEIYTAHALQLQEQLRQSGEGAYNSDKLQVLSQLTRLRQLCCDPLLCYSNYKGGSAKLDTCTELILGGIEGGHKMLLFSQFTSMLELIGKRLKKEGVSYHTLTGATPKEERIRMVGAFQNDDIPVFLISLKAGGTGLNLTAADIVIHYDPWWNVAAQNQATDRTHRIGQEKQVSVFKLIMKDTIEENIMKLQESKKDLAEQIITEGTLSLASLTRADLLEILR